ncbi:transcriptional regulator GlxA family with amidase domain [Neorhizobium galegae]|uniref:GlxA family transcriptional regulator n=1 Tax=Neorhizobium galegae TaxID=399 RepID=UPI001AE58C51|nr:helix-turn-helix domain-containing protein [Neorhizobium galegae]MBP2548341.1 transcriptional regulator GlxA family with amidase domain [Neorhizobium galegae]
MSLAGTASPQNVPVVIVVPPQALLLDIAGPMEVLRYANQHQNGIRFDCRYVSASPRQTTSIGLMLDGLEPLPQTLEADTLLVVSGATEGEEKLAMAAERARLARWMRDAVRPDTRIASICSGALLVAEAGLMEGRHCTTHADCIAELRRLAPTAQVLENRLYVEDGRCFSSAGIATGIDLMLHIVAKMTSAPVALAAARKMVIYLRRNGSDPQISPWLSGRNHVHPAIHQVQDAIMADPAADWPVARLTAVAHLSERHLSRLFREHAGLSLIDYVNQMRVALARDLISQTRLDLENVAARCGFSSARHLRRVWRQHHADPPSLHRAAC